MKEIITYFHTDCLLKNNGINHPERKERLEVVLETIKKIENIKITIKNAPLADLDTVALVHPKNYMNNISKDGMTASNLIDCIPYAFNILRLLLVMMKMQVMRQYFR